MKSLLRMTAFAVAGLSLVGLASAATYAKKGEATLRALDKITGRSTDIVRYLSEGPNSLILLDPEGVQNAENNERFPPAAEAKIAAQVLDQALDGFFAANSGTWPHKFRPPASKQATATSDT